MKKIKKTEEITNFMTNYEFPSILTDILPRPLMFDIETTGFSSKSSHVYLIGTAYLEEQTVVCEQFFAESTEDPDEEPRLLLGLQELAQQFDTFVSFNGSGFDIPFLKGRMEKFGIRDCISSKKQIDLYREALSYKHIFHLENYKQKTIERFLGINRKEDKHTGGELIPVYKEYVKHQDETLFYILLQHNYEDLVGLANLLSLHSMDKIWNGGFTPVSCICSPYQKLDGKTGKECKIICQPALPSPVICSCNNDEYYLHISIDQMFLRIPIYEGSFKHFYPNYKDYYYLPEEDMAIHKSVASFVDKAHRIKANAANCYQKKSGAFLPQYEELKTPAFYKNYKDSISFFEWKEEYSSQPEQLKNYCMHILQTLKKGR